MEAITNIEVGSKVKVRLYSFKSFRHYGGREITTIPFICEATYLFPQTDDTFVVELDEPCMFFKKGHKIAIMPKDFNI